jgi:hypothetical protein
MKKSIIVLLSVLVSLVLGFVAAMAFIVGGSIFENTRWEAPGGYAAVVLFCVSCQFWLARRSGGGLGAGWPTLVGMLSSLLAVCILLVEGGILHSWPMFLSGLLGGFAGVLLSTRRRVIA